MEDIILFIVGIFVIILFFKVWGMCNDVKTITYILSNLASDIQETKSQPIPSAATDAPVRKETAQSAPASSKAHRFTAKQLVIVKEDESQFRIDDVVDDNNGGALYYSEKFNKYYTENEIEDFNEYWAKKK